MDDSFFEFCGNSSVFNLSLLVNSEWPQFTSCFRNSVLVWVPCGWLWLTLPVYLYYLQHLSSRHALPVRILNTLKTFLSLLLILISATQLISEVSDDRNDDSPVANVIYVSSAVKMVTFLLSSVLVQRERRKGVVTSGVLWLFWFSLTIAGIVPFYTIIIQKEYTKSLVQFALFYVYYATVLLQLLLHSFADRQDTHGYQLIGKEPSPELTSSFPSRLTFWWINKLVLLAYRKELTSDDIYDLHPRDKSSRVVPEFLNAWDNEVGRVQWINRTGERHRVHYTHSSQNDRYTQDDDATETTSLLRNGASIKSSPAEGEGEKSRLAEASFFKVLLKTYWWDLSVCFFFKLIYDLLQFVSPQLLDLLIAYTNDKNQESEWKGYVYASSFFVVAVVSSVFYHQHFHVSMTLGMRIKSACISAVYRKSLTMSNEARKESTAGEIVNLMSVDCQRLQDVTGFLYALWSSPLIIVLALTLLWGQLGAAVLAGVAIMVLLIPLNAVLALKLRKYQQEQMKLKDARIKLMNEVLGGMKVLKLYAWEQSFEDKVVDIRNKELHVLKKSAYINAFSSFVWTCAPFLVTLATFATYILMSDDNYLDAGKAFVSLSLFNILRAPINLLPMIISMMAQAQVSLGRLGKFLRNADLGDDNVQHSSDSSFSVKIENGTFTWDTAMALPTLRGIELEIRKGKLVAVVGPVGSGKSSLLSAILGEMEKLQGRVVTQSNAAYVSQQAWIQNATLRDNVLFGTPCKEQQYNKVLDACALRADLDILPGGDMTEIGEKGINLSGGQKQRVSVARAVYHDADLYLLDDPLSAVDSHVGKHIFQQVIGPSGLLKDKTRVLVTHGVHWLPMVDTIVVMADGRITEVGSYDELLEHDGDFAQFLKTYLTSVDHERDDAEEDEEIQNIKLRMLQRVESVTSDGDTLIEEEKAESGRRRSRQLSQTTSNKSDTEEPEALEKSVAAKDKERLTEEEKAESGRVKLSVFMAYFRAIGLGVTGIIFLLYIVYQGLSVFSSIWLSQWTDDDLLANISLANTSDYRNTNYKYLGVYAGLGLGQAMSALLFNVLSSTRMVVAAGTLHQRLLSNTMRAPMSFYDTTPSGRIVNRFSSDVAIVDNTLPATIKNALTQLFGVLSTFIVICYGTPIFVAVIVPLGVFYYLVQRFYIPTSRQLKRLESTTRSPIFNHFSETITGAASIRAYKAQARFLQENRDKVDTNLTFYFFGIASNRWLGFRLQFIGNFVVLAAAMFAVVTPDLEGGLVGLSVSYAMQITASLNWMVRMASDLETNIVSVERIKEYSETPTEARWIIPGRRPPPGWPDTGSVQFLQYSTRYRPGLDLVLKDISCEFSGGEKIGIVGRTGAGKSSMTLALFRLIEAASGSIVIDRQRVGSMGLHDLRSRITILPQDPVLFSGSLRMNLDPFEQYSDHQVWQALKHAHLYKFVSDTPQQLLYECGEGGDNLSVGQRQLVCLARSLLRKTKILVLDEATAAVDMETDELIQNTIRTEFSDCTVITIAHRLNTIMDYDRIVVMDKGQIRECDSPQALLNNKSSIFHSMARDARLV
ncbi:multidrug resistance-associated protein 1-like isoform X2 [Littorina saxatilis]|uniref:multidrug resistance-associated protein 1-like isoform X2 n=1 Tax=Littorina saxatilis TaxID=31220 RepID=UPI0038B619E5